nr:40S ribosomal protein S11-like [Ipomoea batatas]
MGVDIGQPGWGLGCRDNAEQPRVKEVDRHRPVEAETEKAFLKQPGVFLSSKKTGKGKRPGKGGNRYWKSIGLGFKTPREAIEGSNLFCPSWYEKRHSNIAAHVSPCFRVKEGDHVIIGQCRPLSKTVRFNVLKVIPAGSAGGGKKAFTGI